MEAKRIANWKNGLTGVGVILALGGVLGLAVHASTRPACGIFVMGRWTIPYFAILVIISLLGLALVLHGRLASASANTRLGQGLLMSLMSIGLTMLVIDLLMRVTEPPLSQRPPSVQYYPHEVLGYIRPPDLTFEWPELHNEFRPAHQTDQWGFVKDADGNDPDPSARRILFIGDSFVAGLQVDISQNLSVMSQDLLDEATGDRWQSINAGMDSYGPIRYQLSYQVFKETFDPEIVVVGLFVGNDLGDAAQLFENGLVVVDDTGLPVRVEHSYFGGERPPIMPPSEWKRGIVGLIDELVYNNICNYLDWQTIGPEDYFTVPPRDLVVEAYDASREAACIAGEEPCVSYPIRNETLIRYNQDAIFKEHYAEQDLADLQLTRDSLRQLHQAVQADNRKLILVIFPVSHQVPHQGEGIKPDRGLAVGEVIDSAAPQDYLMDFCTEEGLHCVDLLPVFRAHDQENLFWVYDMHLTPRGHEVAAQAIVQEILSVLDEGS